MLLDTTRELFASLREGQRVRLLINGDRMLAISTVLYLASKIQFLKINVYYRRFVF